MTHAPYSYKQLNDAEIAEMVRQLESVTEPLPDLLLRTGAMSGPYRRNRPQTVTVFHRLVLAVRDCLRATA